MRPEVRVDGPVLEGAGESERLVAVGAREGVDAVRDDVGVLAARVRLQLEPQREAVGLGVGRGVRGAREASRWIRGQSIGLSGPGYHWLVVADVIGR